MPSTADVEFNRRAGGVLAERLVDRTVVIVSHQASTLEKFCKQAAVLRNGRLYVFDSLEEARALYDYQA
jgi:capsular polysaccharide transport system ATP-binding protein